RETSWRRNRCASSYAHRRRRRRCHCVCRRPPPEPDRTPHGWICRASSYPLTNCQWAIVNCKLSIPDLRERFLRFLRGQRLAVMIRILRQEMLNRIALDRASNDDAGLALRLLGLIEGGEHFVQIVPVDLLGEPAERLPARHKRPQIEHLRGRP